jgi:hypothetical protein
MAKTTLLPVRGCQDPLRVGDVIFVHGLNGNPYGYWAYQGKRDHWWPEWLGEDLPGVGVWSLGYENAAFKSRKVTFLGGTGLRGFAMPLTDRAEVVLLQLKQEGIGTRPLVFITHSMGGLLVKQLLHTAKDSPNPKYRAIPEQTRGVCFIATPHIGSDLAKWGTYFRTLLGTNVSMDELRPHEPTLRNLKDWYSNYVSAGRASIKTLSFFETRKLAGLGRLVVEPGDADPGVPLMGKHPLEEDHSSICKPDSRTSLLYREVLSFVRNECLRIPNAPPTPTGATQAEGSPSDWVVDGGVRWPAGEDGPAKPGFALPLIGIAAASVVGIALYIAVDGSPTAKNQTGPGSSTAKKVTPESHQSKDPSLDEHNKRDGRTLWVANEPNKTKFIKQVDGTWNSSDDGGPVKQSWRVTAITPSEIRLESRPEGGPVYGSLTATMHEYWTDTTDKTPTPGTFRNDKMWIADEPYRTRFEKKVDGTRKSSDDGGPVKQPWRVTDVTPSKIVLESRPEGGPVIFGSLTATTHEYWTATTLPTSIPGRFR